MPWKVLNLYNNLYQTTFQSKFVLKKNQYLKSNIRMLSAVIRTSSIHLQVSLKKVCLGFLAN